MSVSVPRHRGRPGQGVRSFLCPCHSDTLQFWDHFTRNGRLFFLTTAPYHPQQLRSGWVHPWAGWERQGGRNPRGYPAIHRASRTGATDHTFLQFWTYHHFWLPPGRTTCGRPHHEGLLCCHHNRRCFLRLFFSCDGRLWARQRDHLGE